MARNLYGATSADYAMTAAGALVAGAGPFSVYWARTGGTAVTDLTTVDGVAITQVTFDTDGYLRFLGPDNEKSALWIDTGVGQRIAVRPVDITGETGATGEKGDTGDTGSLAYWWRGEWDATTYYEGEVVTHDGSTWAALRDTVDTEEPGGAATPTVAGSVGGTSGTISAATLWQPVTVSEQTLVTHVQMVKYGASGTEAELRDAAGSVLATYTPLGLTTAVALSVPVMLDPDTTYYFGCYGTDSATTATVSGVVESAGAASVGAWPGTPNSSRHVRLSILDTPGAPWAEMAAAGLTGVAAATTPLAYDAPTQTVSIAVGTTSGTVAAGNDTRITGAAQQAAEAVAIGYVWGSHGYINATTATNAENEMRLWPAWCPQAGTYSECRIQVDTQAPTSSLWRLGVYADNNGIPGALITDMGTVDPTTTGIKAVTGLSMALPYGRIWIALVLQGTASTGGKYYAGVPMPAIQPSSAGTPYTYQTKAGVSAGLPNPAAASAGTATINPPVFEFKRSA